MSKNIGKHPIKPVKLSDSLLRGPVPWLAPLAIMLFLFLIYPTFEVIRFSFTDASILRHEYRYTFNSFRAILSLPRTYVSLRTTFIFVVFSVFFQVGVGLVTALAVDKGESLKMRGTVFVRIVILLSWTVPGVIVGIIWSFLFDSTDMGLLTSFFNRIGVPGITFLTSPRSALVCVIIANIWRGSAQSMMLSYAGLKTIPLELLEAGQIDGANAWQRLTRIILPSIFPVVSTNVILSTIATFNTFDMVMSLTGGGPGMATEILAMTSYYSIFQMHHLGRGSAYAVILLLINSVMAAVYFHVIRKRGGENV